MRVSGCTTNNDGMMLFIEEPNAVVWVVPLLRIHAEEEIPPTKRFAVCEKTPR